MLSHISNLDSWAYLNVNYLQQFALWPTNFFFPPNIRVGFASQKFWKTNFLVRFGRNLHKKGTKKLFSRKKLWMKRLSGVRKEQDCLGKPNKFHSFVTKAYYSIMTSSNGFGTLKYRLLKWLPIHSWYRNFLIIKTSKSYARKSTQFGNIFL